MTAEDKLKDQLALLRNKFRQNLSLKQENINQLVSEILDSNHPQLTPLTNEIHKLAGSAGTFGLPELSGEMKKREADLRSLPQTDFSKTWLLNWQLKVNQAINRAL